MEMECTFICAYCLQPNTIVVDGAAGERQDYIEDCQVCCHPNRLFISVNPEERSAEAVAEPP